MIIENNIPDKMTLTMADKFNSNNRLSLLLMYKIYTIAKTSNKKQKGKKLGKNERSRQRGMNNYVQEHTVYQRGRERKDFPTVS